MLTRSSLLKSVIAAPPKPTLYRARDLYTFGIMTAEGLGREENGTRFDDKWEMYFTANHTTNPTLIGLQSTNTTITIPNDPSPSAMIKAMEAMKKDFRISPWHGIMAKPPMGNDDKSSTTFGGCNLYNYVNEIPHGSREKIEMKPKEPFNPLRQDRNKKDSSLRVFKYGKLPFNYGFIPRTIEDPTIVDPHLKIDGVLGDGDPIDVVELSMKPIKSGDVTVTRVLGVLAMIDEGECDWKIIAATANKNDINDYKSIKDVPKSRLDQIVDWFRMYKTPDGKPENAFAFGAKFLDEAFAMEVIETTRTQYDAIRNGTSAACRKGFWIPEMEKWE